MCVFLLIFMASNKPCNHNMKICFYQIQTSGLSFIQTSSFPTLWSILKNKSPISEYFTSFQNQFLLKCIFLIGQISGFLHFFIYFRFYPVGSGKKLQYCFNSLLMVVQNCMVQWRQPHDVWYCWVSSLPTIQNTCDKK